MTVVLSTLDLLGYMYKKVELSVVTFRAVARRLDKSKTYLVLTHDHLFCMKQGKVEDFKDRSRDRVQTVWETATARCKKCGSRTATKYFEPPSDWKELSVSVKDLVRDAYKYKSPDEWICERCAIAMWDEKPPKNRYSGY